MTGAVLHGHELQNNIGNQPTQREKATDCQYLRKISDPKVTGKSSRKSLSVNLHNKVQIIPWESGNI